MRGDEGGLSGMMGRGNEGERGMRRCSERCDEE